MTEQSAIVWEMICRGSDSAILPVVLRDLCLVLEREAIRRLGSSANELTVRAQNSQMGLVEAKQLSNGHILSRYNTVRKRLHKRLLDCETRLREIDAQIAGVDPYLSERASTMSEQLMIAAALSVVPLVGLFASLWATALLFAARPFALSDRADLGILGGYAARVFLRAAIVSILTAVLGVFLASAPLDVKSGSWSYLSDAVALAAFIGVGLSFRNLSIARATVACRARKPA